MRHLLLLVLTIGIFLTACCTTASLVIGNTRPPTNPDQVKVYIHKPKSYEEIAVINSDDFGVFSFTGQGHLDAAIKRAKKAAAKLGANGVLIVGLQSSTGGSIAITSGYANSGNAPAYGTATTVSSPRTTKNISAVAIWVAEEK